MMKNDVNDPYVSQSSITGVHIYKKMHFVKALSLQLLVNDKYTPKHQLLIFLSHTCPELKNAARCQQINRNAWPKLS